MRILQVNTYDRIGGAALIAWNLHQEYRRRGLISWMAVGSKFSHDPEVVAIPNSISPDYGVRFSLPIPNYISPYDIFLFDMSDRLALLGQKIRRCGFSRLSVALFALAMNREKWRRHEQAMGREDFNFFPSWDLMRQLPCRPDLVHCHNLHGDYFDLRSLPWLSRNYPVAMTLHDAWLMSGHCAHSFDCERWQLGCGNCPDLDIFPAIPHDATAYNWKRKKRIFAKSLLHIATPCQWLMDKVHKSILAPAIIDSRVIPNGVDLSIYRPNDPAVAREKVGLPKGAKILLFVAHYVRQNIWKDHASVREAIVQLAGSLREENVILIALGEKGPSEQIGSATLRYVPYNHDANAVALYYQAADMYLHASKIDTFPNTILEALACGKPVIATAVGGIPEQIKGLKMAGDLNKFPVAEATGILVPPGNPEAIARAIITLMDNPDLARRLGENAALDAHQRFSLTRQVDSYLTWYREILESRSRTRQ
jgi:glycosyltransferase involved in cell wall biosynthesis